MLTSSSAAAVFLLSGLSPLDYSIAFGAVTMAGGFAGKRLLGQLVRRYHCTALIVLVLGGMIGVSMVAIAATGIINLHSKLSQDSATVGELLRLRRICPA